MVFEAGAPGEIDHHARQGFIKWHVGVAIAANAFSVADRLGNRLAQRDADVLDRVVRIDVQVTLGLDVEINQPMSRYLLQHVLEEWESRINARYTTAVQVHRNSDPGLLGVA